MRRKNETSEMMMEYIAEALLMLMRDKSYSDITIGEITKKAGVNRSTYYRHFETKDDIVYFYLNSIMKSYRVRFSMQNDKNFKSYILIMFEEFYSHKDDLILIHKEGLTLQLLSVLMAHFNFDQVVQDKSNMEQFATSYHIGGIYNNMLLWFSHDMKETPEEMTEIAISYRPKDSLSLFDIHSSDSLLKHM